MKIGSQYHTSGHAKITSDVSSIYEVHYLDIMGAYKTSNVIANSEQAAKDYFYRKRGDNVVIKSVNKITEKAML